MFRASLWTRAGCIVLAAATLGLREVLCSPTPPVGVEELEKQLANLVQDDNGNLGNIIQHGAYNPTIRFDDHTWHAPSSALHGQVSYPPFFPPTYPATLHYHRSVPGSNFMYTEPLHATAQFQDTHSTSGPGVLLGAGSELLSRMTAAEHDIASSSQQYVTNPDFLLNQGIWGSQDHHTPLNEAMATIHGTPVQQDHSTYGAPPYAPTRLETNMQQDHSFDEPSQYASTNMEAMVQQQHSLHKAPAFAPTHVEAMDTPATVHLYDSPAELPLLDTSAGPLPLHISAKSARQYAPAKAASSGATASIVPSDGPESIDAFPSQDLPQKDVARDAVPELKELHKFKSRYQTILQQNADIDYLVAMMRFRVSAYAQAGENVPLSIQRPARIAGNKASELDAIAINIFWRRAIAKELTITGRTGPRRLLVTFSPRLRFLAEQNEYGYIGVWELGPSQEDTVPKLFLYGFYEFTAEEFIRLDLLPEVKGNLWVTARHDTKGLERPLVLKFVKMKDAEVERAASTFRLNGGRFSRAALQDQDVYMHLERTGVGRYIYIFRPSHEVDDLVHKWTEEAGLRHSALNPIQLALEHQLALNRRMINAFRSGKQVKMIDLPDGEPLMLSYHHRFIKFGHSNIDVMAVWKFGQVEGTGTDTHRKLYGIGFFHATQVSWSKLTPETIQGLRYSWFDFNTLRIP